MTFRFTLSHDVLGNQVISEPDGWEGATLSLERDMDLFTLIETFSGGANDAFIFYGDNGTENGGIDFIRQVIFTYGFDADLTLTIEYAPDDITFSTLFTGLLDLSAKNEMKDNRMQIPVIRDDFWTKFMNRFETPVNLSDLVDLDGNAVDAVEPVTVQLTSQTLRKQHYSFEPDKGIAVTIEIGSTDLFLQYTPGEFDLDEMEDFYHLTPFNNAERPTSTFDVVEEGTYAFDIQWTMSAIFGSIENHVNNLDGIYLQVNDGDLIPFSSEDFTIGGFDWTVFTLETTLYLLSGDNVRIYGKATDSSQTITYGFWGTNGLMNGPFDAPTYDQPRPSGMDAVPTFTRVTADTVYPASEAQGYLIHDLIHGVLARIGLGIDPLYSEFLGSTFTKAKQYENDGCGWMYAILKGLQIRQYTLSEKPFFISFKDIWEGINPILNLALGYEQVDGSQVIRIEQKVHFVPSGETPPVNFSNVREIASSYDKDFIFKTIRTGYKKWQSEDISGIDDPQAKQVRSTRIQNSGIDITLESDFIAAGLAIETTRRKKREKSADYKFDNDNFIIALNDNDLSPDVYLPELDENYDSVSGLINSTTRYNLILSPLRNFLRWARYFSGCLQSYLSSSYKFVSGEGNYDMETDYSCTNGNECQAIICDSLSESDDIALSYPFGFYFLPELFDITIPMEKEEYDLIDRKKPIGISQTDTGHVNFVIKSLKYDLLKGEAKIQAWPEETFNITVPEQNIITPDCGYEAPAEGDFDADYQAILDYATGEGYTLPSAGQQILQNQFVLDLKDAGAWDRLDVLYVFATDGNRDFAKINWIDPGAFDCAEINTPTFTVDEGFNGNGSNSGLDTTWVPATDAVNYSLNDACIFHHTNTDAQSNTAIEYGVRHATNGSSGRILIQVRTTLNTIGSLALNSGVAGAGSNSNAIGFYLNTRNSSGTTDHDIYKDAVLNDGSNAASGVLPDQSVYICGFHESTGAFNSGSSKKISCWGAGSAMGDIQAALYTAWNTYFTSL